MWALNWCNDGAYSQNVDKHQLERKLIGMSDSVTEQVMPKYKNALHFSKYNNTQVNRSQGSLLKDWMTDTYYTQWSWPGG